MKKLITSSDAGGVKIGVDQFTIVIPNGYGDGDTEVFIYDDNDKIDDDIKYNQLKFLTFIDGEKINIYSYDCGNEVAETISGRYGVYYYDGCVYFESWNYLKSNNL